MLLARITYFSIELLAPLASESMSVKPTTTCRIAIATNQPCAPAWVSSFQQHEAWRHCLLFVSVIAFLLLIVSSRRLTDLDEDPSNIRSMATLLGDIDLQRDFQQIEPTPRKTT